MSSCQDLCGPRGPPAEVLGHFYCPNAFQSMKDTVGSEGGVVGFRWSKMGGDQFLNWGSGEHRLSRPILHLKEPQGRQMHLPEIHTSGPDAYLPISKVLQNHSMCHTPGSIYTPPKAAHQFKTNEILAIRHLICHPFRLLFIRRRLNLLTAVR